MSVRAPSKLRSVLHTLLTLSTSAATLLFLVACVLVSGKKNFINLAPPFCNSNEVCELWFGENAAEINAHQIHSVALPLDLSTSQGACGPVSWHRSYARSIRRDFGKEYRQVRLRPPADKYFLVLAAASAAYPCFVIAIPVVRRRRRRRSGQCEWCGALAIEERTKTCGDCELRQGHPKTATLRRSASGTECLYRSCSVALRLLLAATAIALAAIPVFAVRRVTVGGGFPETVADLPAATLQFSPGQLATSLMYRPPRQADHFEHKYGPLYSSRYTGVRHGSNIYETPVRRRTFAVDLPLMRWVFVAALVAGAWPAWTLLRIRSRRRKRLERWQRWLCMECEYPLRASESRVCPECGAENIARSQQ